MAINFPSTPSLNDTHTHSGITYKWDGSTWKTVGNTSTYSLPTASSTVLGGIKVGTRLTINSGVLEADVQGGTYGDSDVDTHLNQSNPTSGYVLSWNGSDYAWVEQSSSGTTYDLTAENGSVATEEKIQLSGSDNSEDSVTLAVDASSSLTIARANNKITFGGGTYSAGTGLSLSGTTFNVTSTYTSSRTTAAATTSSIADQASANIDITAAKAYALLKIQTSHAAWVTLYTDTTSRTSDANRNITTDPLPGSGVVAEVLLSDGGVQKISPGLIGYNDDATPSTNVYAKVQNRSGSAATITVTLHYLALEG